MHELRTRLAGAVAAIVVVALAATFAVVERRTDNQLRGRIDGDLRAQAALLGHQLARGTSPQALVRSLPYSEASRLVVVRRPGAPIASNQPELIDPSGSDDPPAERRSEAAEAAALQRLRAGLATIAVVDVGRVRLLTVSARNGTLLTVGEPLASVARALEEVREGFLIGGGLAALAAVALAYWVGSRLTGPLRAMARTAARIDAGDLSPRIKARGPRDEVRALGDTLDHMLDRLDDAFARQRAFVADASHELRTPLTVIRGQIEVLARQPTVAREDVKRIERAVHVEVDRLDRLVEDLLALTRTDAQPLTGREPLDVDAFLAELLAAAGPTARRRFELAGVPAGRLPADRDRLAQAVRNLLRNAIEHTREGGLVRLTACRRGAALEIAVEDDGPGIPPDQRDRVFDRFHRVEPGRRPTGGAGLGLAIVRAIAEAHGGSVFAGESPEGGARIGLILPGFVPAAA